VTATTWLDPPCCTDDLAAVCESDARIIGAFIHEKRKLLTALRNHGHGDCKTATNLKAQIASLRAQQKQWADGAVHLQHDKPPVGSKPNRTRAARSTPPKSM